MPRSGEPAQRRLAAAPAPGEPLYRLRLRRCRLVPLQGMPAAAGRAEAARQGSRRPPDAGLARTETRCRRRRRSKGQMIDDIFLATLASELRDLAQAPALQGTAERLELERLAACVERETEGAAPAVAKTEKAR